MPTTVTQLDLEEVVRASESLPPFPDIIWKVMPLLKRTAPAAEIEAVIRYDQAITARVLALSQSTYYSRRFSIKSLKEAIVRLGQQQLLKVILIASSNRYFRNAASGYDLCEGELWEHAVGTALMTDIVGTALGWQNSVAAYTAGLMHDIGKTVLSFFVETYFDSILNLVKEERMSFLEAERRILSIDHQQLGMAITRRWRFPEEVVTAIGHHHCPLEAKKDQELARLVYVANRMVSSLGVGCGVDGFLQPNQDEVFTELGISTLMAERLLADLAVALQEVRQFFRA